MALPNGPQSGSDDATEALNLGPQSPYEPGHLAPWLEGTGQAAHLHLGAGQRCCSASSFCLLLRQDPAWLPCPDVRLTTRSPASLRPPTPFPSASSEQKIPMWNRLGAFDSSRRTTDSNRTCGAPFLELNSSAAIERSRSVGRNSKFTSSGWWYSLVIDVNAIHSTWSLTVGKAGSARGLEPYYRSERETYDLNLNLL